MTEYSDPQVIIGAILAGGLAVSSGMTAYRFLKERYDNSKKVQLLENELHDTQTGMARANLDKLIKWEEQAYNLIKEIDGKKPNISADARDLCDGLHDWICGTIIKVASRDLDNHEISCSGLKKDETQRIAWAYKVRAAGRNLQPATYDTTKATQLVETNSVRQQPSSGLEATV